MKKIAASVLVFVMAASVTMAQGRLGFFLGSSNSDVTGEDLLVGGIKAEFDINESLSLELRASLIDLDDQFDDQVVPLEIGLLGRIPLGMNENIELYGGGGIGYYMWSYSGPITWIDDDQSIGFYVFAGARFAISMNARLFLEVQYQKADDFDTQTRVFWWGGWWRLSITPEVNNTSVNAGLLFEF